MYPDHGWLHVIVCRDSVGLERCDRKNNPGSWRWMIQS